MIIMAFTLQTIAVNRENLINQRAQLLARQAAESGLARAKQCIRSNDNLVTWTETKPLKPNTDCKGNVVRGRAAYIVDTGDYRSEFEVYPAESQDGFRSASSRGIVDLMRKNDYSGRVINRSHRHTASVYIMLDLTFDDIAFGSVYAYGNDIYTVGGPQKQEAAYFFTKTISGQVFGVGSNVDDVIRGYRRDLGSSSYPQGLRMEFPANTKIRKIITDFQGGGWNAYFLTYDGEVYVTGINANGLMGNNLYNYGPTGPSRIPKPHPIWPNETKVNIGAIDHYTHGNVDNIVTSGSVTYLVTKSGVTYAIGRNWGIGALGTGPRFTGDDWKNSYVNDPYPLRECYGRPDSKPIRFRYVSPIDNNRIYTDTMYYANRTNTCAIYDTYSLNNKHDDPDVRVVSCWGDNRRGQVDPAYKMSNPYCGSSSRSYYPMPTPIYSKEEHLGYQTELHAIHGDPIDVKTDGETTYILTEKGSVLAQGDNTFGQAGCTTYYNLSTQTPEPDKCKLNALKFNTPYGSRPAIIKKMVVDAFSALFLDDQGRVWGIGLNDVGQLGSNYDVIIRTPTLYKLPMNKKAVDIFLTSPSVYSKNRGRNTETNIKYNARYYRHSLVLTEDGEVYGSGSNYYGQLGVGRNYNDIQNRCQESDFTNSNHAQVAARGAVGNYISPGVNQPVRMCLAQRKYNASYEKVKARQIRAGLGTSVIITDNNKVFTVGHNHQGQLGSADRGDRSVPEAHKLTNQWNVWHY